MGDIKRQPAKQRPATGRLALTASREEWLIMGWNMIDDLTFEDLFENEDHCRKIWEKYKDKLMKGEYQFSWFAQPTKKEAKKRKPWAFHHFK